MNGQGNLLGVLGQDYDEAMAAEARADFAPIPAGLYKAIITDSGFKETKDKKGQYLELTHQITEGPYANRLLWARLNLVNANKQARDIANADLASIRKATGVERPSDSAEFHNKPLVIRVEFVPADGVKNRKDGNEIKAWKSIADAGDDAAAHAATGSNSTAAPTGPAVSQPAANGAAKASPAWGRNAA